MFNLTHYKSNKLIINQLAGFMYLVLKVLILQTGKPSLIRAKKITG